MKPKAAGLVRWDSPLKATDSPPRPERIRAGCGARSAGQFNEPQEVTL